MKNLVYMCVFRDKDFLRLLQVLLKSIQDTTKERRNFDVLVLTHPSFTEYIKDILKKLSIPINVVYLEYTSVVEAKAARLHIFDVPNINQYKTMLYLDTDIVVGGNLSDIFDHKLDDKLYVVEDGCIDSQFLGGRLFDFTRINPNTRGFNSGVLLFNNCDSIHKLFKTVNQHIHDYHAKYELIGHVDQQFLNYHAIPLGLYNVNLMGKYCTNSPSKDMKYINHFAGSHGSTLNKYNYVTQYLKDKLKV